MQEPDYLISNLDPDLEPTSIQHRNCLHSESLLRDPRSAIFQRPSLRLRDAMHIDRLLMVDAISLLLNRLESEAIRQGDPHGPAEPCWQQGLSFLHLAKRQRRAIQA
jgi:hypothetical protein